MEKIQSAIAKARAERARLGGAPPPPPAPIAPLQQPPRPESIRPESIRPEATRPEASRPAAPAAAPLAPAAQAPLAPAAQAPLAQAPVPRPVEAEGAAEAVPPAVEAAWRALSPLRPDARRMARARIVAQEAGPEAAPFDVMRTRLLQQCRANGWRRVAITSPGPGCGKSTVALNLAFSLARQRDLRTVLIEADLRRPSLAKMLGVRDPVSVARVLEGTEPFARHALRHGTNLAVAMNQGPARNPAELLHGPNVAPVLAAVEQVYAPTVMLFDLPPLFANDDALAFVGHVDAVLIIAAAERTTIAEVDACERDLAAHVPVMGVVLNKCRYLGPAYGYGYGYG
jgi:Mrp family chromosome partitioning ATPase